MSIVLIRDLNDFGEHKADCGGKLVQIWYVDPPLIRSKSGRCNRCNEIIKLPPGLWRDKPIMIQGRPFSMIRKALARRGRWMEA